MERTLVGELAEHVGKEVSISGWVDVRRDHGKLIFLDIRDRSGKVQVVAHGEHPEALAIAQAVRGEWVVEAKGKVQARPPKMVTEGPNGDVELDVAELAVITRAAELPFDKDAELNIDTLLDYRPYTLRSARERDIFKVQATVVDAYRKSLAGQDFTEFQAPALVGADAEGGSAVFKVEYFYDKTAYLATSPQLYKQIMVGAFERVFTIARIFRAEKSATTRHLSEVTQMDFEMGFIKDETDVMDMLELVVRDTVAEVVTRHAEVLKRFQVEEPLMSEKFPVLTLREAEQILGVPEAGDLDPEGERRICEWAKKEKGSDFVFITRFPTAARAFYTMAAEDPAYSRGFDLLFRGLEVNSGAERIHDYDEMVRRIESRRMDPKKFSFYLQAFKYGLPPHGGCSTGLERFTMKLLDLPSVKEASLFPRDLNRIDLLLHESDVVKD